MKPDRYNQLCAALDEFTLAVLKIQQAQQKDGSVPQELIDSMNFLKDEVLEKAIQIGLPHLKLTNP
jgi:hypothetical protein